MASARTSGSKVGTSGTTRLSNAYRLDRSVVSIASLEDDPDEIEYWHSTSPEEGLRAAEFMRQIAYEYDACAARLQ